MLVATERTYPLPPAFSEGFPEASVGIWLSRANAREDGGPRNKPGCVALLSMGYLEDLTHRPGHTRHSQWQNQPSTRKQTIEPERPRMGGASVNKNRIGRTGIVFSTISMDSFDLR